jgi:hypothetical protein
MQRSLEDPFCGLIGAREPNALQKLDGKDASVGLNDAQRHHRVNFPCLRSREGRFSGLIGPRERG